MSLRDIGDIRLADLMTFLAVHRHRSVTAAARELSVTASQVSKAITRLEASLRAPLFERTPRGVTPTEEATRIFPKLEEIVTRARDLERGGDVEQRYTLAAPSYLCSDFVGGIVSVLSDGRVRLLEAGPAQIRAFAGENLFQIALTFGPQQLTPSWLSNEVGLVRSGLFTTPALAKAIHKASGPKANQRSLEEHPFVLPLYHSGGEFVPGDDGCPLTRTERKRGHEAASYQCALEIAAVSDQLVFGPINAAKRFTESNRLVEIDVRGWHVTSPLFLHVNADRITGPTHKRMVSALEAVCKQQGQTESSN
jgi:DNA-binding transcriptional LysR family regulator